MTSRWPTLSSSSSSNNNPRISTAFRGKYFVQIEIATPTHPPKQKKAPICMLEKVMEKRGDGELEIGHEEMEM